MKAKKTGASIKSVISLIIIKINNIDAFFKKIARRKAIPTARFLAIYSPELNETSDPTKNEGLFKAMYGPTNMGQTSKKRIITNHQVKVIFLSIEYVFYIIIMLLYLDSISPSFYF